MSVSLVIISVNHTDLRGPRRRASCPRCSASPQHRAPRASSHASHSVVLLSVHRFAACGRRAQRDLHLCNNTHRPQRQVVSLCGAFTSASTRAATKSNTLRSLYCQSSTTSALALVMARPPGSSRSVCRPLTDMITRTDMVNVYFRVKLTNLTPAQGSRAGGWLRGR